MLFRPAWNLSALLSALLVAPFLLLSSGCESSSVQYNKEGYASKFGVMAPAQGGTYRVYAETTQIHMHPVQDYVHGFEVIRRDGTQFIGYCEISFPEPIKVSPEMEKAYTVLDGGRRIRSEGKVFWGLWTSPFWFSEGDPIGPYELKIFIDGDLYRTVKYDVIPFESAIDF